MCGIAGYVRKNIQANEVIAKAMVQRIKHRGPDGDGIYCRDNVALGHARLSIIDLELGKQPMCDGTRNIFITYNGELYNYRELKKELEAEGFQFCTHSDTEVIIYSYKKWHTQCLHRFRGMFAFCIADFQKKELFLARDHFGIKPLVYYHQPGIFAFSSELQAFQALEEFDPSLDIEAIDQYLWLQYIPAPKTIFQHTYKLPPAHYLLVNFEGEILERKRYHVFTFSPDTSKTEQEWLEEMGHIISESVKAHLVADVPFGAFLSGGIDSSLVVSYMAQHLPQPVKTFSIGFSEEAYNETHYARQVAQRWHTEHYEEIVKPEALEILPQLVTHYGEPFGDSSAIPTYYVCRLARQHVPMVLSGDGGDELFAGYNSYHAWMKNIEGHRLGWLSHLPWWKQKLYPLAHLLFPHRFPQKPYIKRKPELSLWLECMQYLSFDWRTRLWKDEFQPYIHPQIDSFRWLEKEAALLDPVHKAQFFDLHTYLPYDILTKVDIASMMHGLEVRTPLVDLNVWEAALRIPSPYNFQKNGTSSYQGKLLLKKILLRYFPNEFVYRPKMGFGVPVAIWMFENNNALKNIKDRLTDPGSKLADFFNLKPLTEYVRNKDYGTRIWLLIFLEEWLRQFEKAKIA